jgi:hypothetical protein
VSYLRSVEVQQFLKKVIKIVKKSELGIYEQFSTKKKKQEMNQSNSRNGGNEEIQNGLEFFFSNVMIKCY